MKFSRAYFSRLFRAIVGQPHCELESIAAWRLERLKAAEAVADRLIPTENSAWKKTRDCPFRAVEYYVKQLQAELDSDYLYMRAHVCDTLNRVAQGICNDLQKTHGNMQLNRVGPSLAKRLTGQLVKNDGIMISLAKAYMLDKLGANIYEDTQKKYIVSKL